LTSIFPGLAAMVCGRDSRLFSGMGLILLSSLMGLGLASAARAGDQCDGQTVVGGPLVAFYFDQSDALISAELVSVTRSIKPSTRSGLKLIANAGPLPIPPGAPRSVFQAAGAAVTAVYVQNSRTDITSPYEYKSIVAVEDMSGVTDRQFVPIDAKANGACRCSKIPCPQGMCCPQQCM
jgi:hypothetical protein